MSTPFPAAVRATLVALLVAYLVWNSLYYLPYTVDDAFVSFRYARNLAEGAGLVYNPGERIEGYSNFTWVMISALLIRLGLPFLVSLKIVGLLVTVALAFAVLDLVRVLLFGSRWREPAALLAFALVCTNTSVAVWSQAGLEGNLLALLLVASVSRFERELRDPSLRPWSAALFALVVMTRPEGAMYGAWFGGRLLLRALRDGERRSALRWATVAVPPIVLYEAWGLAYYGALLPNTYLAKTGQGSGSAVSLLLDRLSPERYFGRFLFGQGVGFLALLAIAVVGGALGRRRPWGVWIPVLSGLAFVLWAGGDWMPRHRLFIPVLPLLLAGCALGAAELARLAEGRRAVTAGLALVLLSSVGDYVRVQGFVPESSETLAGRYVRMARGAWWLDVPDRLREQRYPFTSLAMEILQTAPEDEYVVIRDIGFPGWFSNNPIWDAFGLVTRASAVARRDPSEAAQQAAVDDLLAHDPAMIILRLGRPESYARDLLGRLQADARFTGRYVSSETTAGLEVRSEKARGYYAIYRRADSPVPSGPARLDRAIERLDGAPLPEELRTALP